MAENPARMKVPQIIVDLTDSLNNPKNPRFSRDLVAINLENIVKMCTASLDKYNAEFPRRK